MYFKDLNTLFDAELSGGLGLMSLTFLRRLYVFDYILDSLWRG